jgi:hypothetical protein
MLTVMLTVRFVASVLFIPSSSPTSPLHGGIERRRRERGGPSSR